MLTRRARQAYPNLENSGRELESIVVGEMQKAYNAFAGIQKRESDVARATVQDLRSGPIAMPMDVEWNDFIYRMISLSILTSPHGLRNTLITQGASPLGRRNQGRPSWSAKASILRATLLAGT